MINEKLSLHLNVEPATSRSLSQCSVSLRSVSKWLQSLPLLNVEGTIQPIASLTKELSVLDVDPGTLFECIETVASHVVRIMDHLEGKYLTKSAENDSQFVQAVKVAHSINHWALDCYLRVIIDQNTVKNDLVLSVARSMEWLFKILLRCYYLYIPAPKHIWPRLNTLFMVAHEGGFSRELVEMITQQNKKVSIRNLYLQSVVLTLINPMQLQHKQLKDLAQVCPLLATRVRIIPKEGNQNSLALFEIDVLGGKAPKYRSDFADPSVKTRAAWYIDFSLIVAAIDGKHKVSESIDAQIRDAIPGDLKHQMLRVWSELPKRKAERIDTNESVDVILGMPHNFGMRSGGLNPERFVKLHFQGIKMNEDAASEIGSMHHQLYSGKLINFTEGRGACVQFDITPSDLISGELISVKVKDCWMVGIVRWVKKMTGQSSECGVEFFSSDAEPCVVRIAADDTYWGRYTPALFSVKDGLGFGQLGLVTSARLSLNCLGMQVFTLKRVFFLRLTETIHMTGSVLVSTYAEVSRDSLPPLTGSSKAQFADAKNNGAKQPSNNELNPWQWG